MNRIDSIEIAPGIYAGIYADPCPMNPWDSWDTCPPLLAYSDRCLVAYGEAVTPSDLVSRIPAGVLRTRKGQDAALAACGIDRDAFDRWREDFGGTPAETARDAIREAIARGEAANCDRPGHYGGHADYFGCLESLADLAGIPTHRETWRGCSQGDWADLIAFALPEDKGQRWGGDPGGSLRQSCALWGQWAGGDVYEYVLEGADGEPLEFPDGTPGGSCGGFCGSDHEESGLLDYARSDASALAASCEQNAF